MSSAPSCATQILKTSTSVRLRSRPLPHHYGDLGWHSGRSANRSSGSRLLRGHEISTHSSRVKSKNSHHDTHATAPQFVQDAYHRYLRGKNSEIDADATVIDFQKGLNDEQKQVMTPIATIAADVVKQACTKFRDSVLGIGHRSKWSDYEYHDVVVYEHQQFPGLQITPGILPPEAQMLFLGKIMHDCLANPKHNTNLHAEYDLEYPEVRPTSRPSTSDMDRSQPRRSLFTYTQNDIKSVPKDASAHPSINMVQYLSRKLRWLTVGEQYDWPTRSYSGKDETPFPIELQELVADLFPHIRSESGVCLLYGSKGYMPVHRDVSEQCERALASFSFGCDGIFLVARGEDEVDDVEEQKKRIVAIRVHSGDCIHMTGETRWAWHAMPRTISATCPDYLNSWPAGTLGADGTDSNLYEAWRGFMGSKRLNVSCRQVWD